MNKIEFPVYGSTLLLDKPLYIMGSVAIDLPRGCRLTQSHKWVTVWNELGGNVGFNMDNHYMIEVDGCYKVLECG